MLQVNDVRGVFGVKARQCQFAAVTVVIATGQGHGCHVGCHDQGQDQSQGQRQCLSTEEVLGHNLLNVRNRIY